jgi:hypothetical protein
MSQRFIEELRQENLCTHFILPLLKLNKFSFLSSNFVNAYLSSDGRFIMVEVVEVQLLSRRVYTEHPHYHFTSVKDLSWIIVYSLPKHWEKDIRTFIEGNFSRMSVWAKEAINRYSKLPNSISKMDGRLLGLNKHPKLKEMWEREIEVSLDTGMELLSKPSELSFMNIEDLTPLDHHK